MTQPKAGMYQGNRFYGLFDQLCDELLPIRSQIAGMEVQISSLKEYLEKEHQRWRDAQNNYERQVILQSDTIQVLTKTSRALSLLQDEISQLRKLSDTQKSENNKILHSRLESLHIKLADNERTSVGSSGAGDAQGDNGLQTVVTYLRRSKEIAETEISLLRQEKLRLQSQVVDQYPNPFSTGYGLPKLKTKDPMCCSVRECRCGTYDLVTTLGALRRCSDLEFGTWSVRFEDDHLL